MTIEAISLFSGAGGLDVGAEQAGVKITHCVEIDPDSAATLRLNAAPNSKVVHQQNVQGFDFGGLRSAADQIVIGGPPCQPFSKNGYWVKNENRASDLDPRNLLDQFIRCLREVRPRGFLFENVESILHPTNLKSLERFVTMANELGYSTSQYRSNALDFGVPQRRKRVFVFGVKKANVRIPEPFPTHQDAKGRGLFNSQLPLHRGVRQFIEEYEDPSFAESEEDASKGTYFKELCAVTPGRNYMSLSDLPDYKGRTFVHGKRFWNFLFKLHPDEPSITIAAQPGPWVGPFHWTNRRLRVPEIAAIQTFPRHYKFAGSRRSIQRQIGNAVPCLLGRRMIGHLLEAIE
jgi:DNA (cytosine-5)-methyltransferase 1